MSTDETPKPPRPQCRATSKQRKRAGEADPRCRRRPSPNKTLCIFHGGRNEGVPALQRIKHGLQSAFVRVDDVAAITSKIEQARSAEGRKELLARNTALLQHRLENVPVTAENLQLAAGGAEAVRRQLETLDKLSEAADQGPVHITIADYASGASPVSVRTSADGTGVMLMILGTPHIQDERGAWHPAIEVTDEATGVTIYERADSTH